MQLSVIIVNYRVYPYLSDCIESVKKAIAGIAAEIIVVDNESDAAAILAIQLRFADIQVIANADNRGYSSANNQALSISKGNYVLFLNPDTLVPVNAVNQCIGHMNAHPDAGAIGVKMVNEQGVFLPESKRSFPTPLPAFFKLSGIAALFPASGFFNRYALGNLNADSNHCVDILAGAFFFTRKEIMNRLNGFDERFFMYGEDIDLSKRIQNLDFKNYYLGSIELLHYKGASTNKNSSRYHRYFYRSMELFVEKYYPGNANFLKRTGLLAGIAMAKKIALLKNGLS